MSGPHHCRLTPKDYSILETLLEHCTDHDQAYRHLLRLKLLAARVISPDTVPPQLATINSRVDFAVDGGPADNRILIHGKDNALPGLTLPITTLRGLALLGLSAGETVAIERPDGRREELRLNEVSHQPEVSRASLYQPSPMGADRASGEGCSVVLLSSHRKRTPVDRVPLRRDDDDPGPSAA